MSAVAVDQDNAPPALQISGVSKRYGSVTAVDNISLSVEPGTFLTLLGPSGSGKTTVLMMVAGFVIPSTGAIHGNGRPLTRLAPDKRNFGMVFQGYALFPHLSVAENVRFPLKVRGFASAEHAERVRAALSMVQMETLAARLPGELSGGQQQRVALARALVFEPDILLLDEPLSALDKKLRAELQWELKALHHRLKTTFIYVTHDQEEALSMSDQIAILRDGKIVQQGVPEALYERPASRFVADFLGKSNFLRGRVESSGSDQFTFSSGGQQFTQATLRGDTPAKDSQVLIALRPEKAMLHTAGRGSPAAYVNQVTGEIADFNYYGSSYHFRIATENLGELSVVLPAWRCPLDPRTDSAVSVAWEADAAVVVEDEQ